MDGPVPRDGVLPLRRTQSNWSELNCRNPHKLPPVSKLHENRLFKTGAGVG